jgi:hypothetical protein
MKGPSGRIGIRRNGATFTGDEARYQTWRAPLHNQVETQARCRDAGNATLVSMGSPRHGPIVRAHGRPSATVAPNTNASVRHAGRSMLSAASMRRPVESDALIVWVRLDPTSRERCGRARARRATAAVAGPSRHRYRPSAPRARPGLVAGRRHGATVRRGELAFDPVGDYHVQAHCAEEAHRPPPPDAPVARDAHRPPNAAWLEGATDRLEIEQRELDNTRRRRGRRGRNCVSAPGPWPCSETLEQRPMAPTRWQHRLCG